MFEIVPCLSSTLFFTLINGGSIYLEIAFSSDLLEMSTKSHLFPFWCGQYSPFLFALASDVLLKYMLFNVAFTMVLGSFLPLLRFISCHICVIFFIVCSIRSMTFARCVSSFLSMNFIGATLGTISSADLRSSIAVHISFLQSPIRSSIAIFLHGIRFRAQFYVSILELFHHFWSYSFLDCFSCKWSTSIGLLAWNLLSFYNVLFLL